MNSTTKQCDTTESPKPRPRRFAQFGISFILLVTLCIAILLGWMDRNQRQAKFEQMVIDTYTPTTVYYDHQVNAPGFHPLAKNNQTIQTPGWWLAKRLYGEHVFSRVAFMTIQFGDMCDVDLLKHTPELRVLRLKCCENLHCLDGISALRNLETLHVVDCESLLDVELFSVLPDVKTLEFSCSYMQPEFFDRLAELERLESLTVWCRDEIESTVRYAALKQIKKLELSAPRIYEIDGLKEMKQLESLKIVGTMTLKQFVELKEALPNTQIQTSAGLGFPRPFVHPIDAPERRKPKILDWESRSVSMLQFDEKTMPDLT